jgi:hypothetical protein
LLPTLFESLPPIHSFPLRQSLSLYFVFGLL